MKLESPKARRQEGQEKKKNEVTIAEILPNVIKVVFPQFQEAQYTKNKKREENHTKATP